MLSAHEERIITDIEQKLVFDDPWWAARFDRLGRKQSSPTRRWLTRGAVALIWLAMMCTDAVRGPAVLFWGMLAAGVLTACVYWWLRRRQRARYGAHLADQEPPVLPGSP